MPSETRNYKTSRREIPNSHPKKRIFLKQLISAIICFVLIKYITASPFSYSAYFKEKIKEGVSYDADLSIVTSIVNKFKTPPSNITNN